MFISISCFAQLPDSLKHVEIISDVQDTMIVINKKDADIINTAFYRCEILDSLNVINEELISALQIENSKLESIVSEQKAVIEDKDVQILHIKLADEEVISNLEKQIKRANNWTRFWQCTTGAGVIASILLVIL